MSSLHPNYISKCQTKVHHRGWSVSALERTLPLPLPPTQASNCGPPSEALFASSANQPLITEHRWQELRVSTNTDASDTSEKNSLLSVWVPEVCSHSCGTHQGITAARTCRSTSVVLADFLVLNSFQSIGRCGSLGTTSICGSTVLL